MLEGEGAQLRSTDACTTGLRRRTDELMDGYRPAPHDPLEGLTEVASRRRLVPSMREQALASRRGAGAS